ncbi:MAG TPA: phosphomannomutase/phosphoglucomutase [Syntrophomonadaceae bacterium]|nr:phosphomannomutase/phosphoglucomutase [Syntrophomonadaceae bacterium]HPU49526.1 phosphomannomutase/phosphoglucomutase [Syntrophomonadaceae bacterium]
MMSTIFRQYDIRGIVGRDLDDEQVDRISRAFAAYACGQGQTQILLGYDNRHSSPHFRDIAAQALVESGFRVIDLGMVITPMFYFACHHLNIRAGLMITASHNPPEYNGFKLLLGESTIYGDQIQEVKRIAEEGAFLYKDGGSLETYDIQPAYHQMILEKIKMGPRLIKAVVDCGNGTASLFAPQILRDLGCEVVELYCESDPDYPHHHPDPVNPNNMDDLVDMVLRCKADLGIGFDGDGDRLGVVDSHGNMIWGDLLMILFWRELLPRYPGTPAIVEVKCSQSLIDEIKRLGGKPVLYKTGHSLIKAKMKEIGAIFTGEMSGHMFFADEYYGYDDAIYAAARLLSLLSRQEKSLAELLQDVPRYYSTPEIRIPSTDAEKFHQVERVIQHFEPLYEIIKVDGARILFPQGWGLVRASNTGPELIVRCEGNTPQALEEIKSELFSFLAELGLPMAEEELIKV